MVSLETVLMADPEMQLRFVTEPVCSVNDEYCATVQIKLKESDIASDNEVLIGTSSILISYTPSVLQFENYTSHNFDGSNVCFDPDPNLVVWSEQTTDNVDGFLNITLDLLVPGDFSCPAVNSSEWIDVGTICFLVTSTEGNSGLQFDIQDMNTNFNTSTGQFGFITVDEFGAFSTVEPPLINSTVPIISNLGEAIICDENTGSPESTVLFLISETPEGFFPQWQRNGIDLNHQLDSLIVDSDGVYSVFYESDNLSDCITSSSNEIIIETEDCGAGSTGDCPIVQIAVENIDVCLSSLALDFETIYANWENSVSVISDNDGTLLGSMIISGTSPAASDFPMPPPTIGYEGDGCDPFAITWYAAYGCDSNYDGEIDSYIPGGFLNLNVYPDPQIPIINKTFDVATQECAFSIETICEGDTFDLIDDLGTAACDDPVVIKNMEVTNIQGCTVTHQVEQPSCYACGTGVDSDCWLAVTDVIVSECSSEDTYFITIEYDYNYNYTNIEAAIYIFTDVASQSFGEIGFGEPVILGPFEIGEVDQHTFKLFRFPFNGCTAETGVILPPNCDDSCNEPNQTSTASLTTCSGGQAVDLTTFLPANTTAVWTYGNGGSVANPSSYVEISSSCETTTKIINATFITNTTEGCPVENVMTIEATIYPKPTMDLDAGTCLLVLESSCPNAPVSWSDDLGNSGTGFSYEAEIGTAGTVTFIYDVNDCFQEYSASFNCIPDCNEPAQNLMADLSICSGELINLTTFLPENTNTGVEWTNSTGNTIANPSDYAENFTGCENKNETVNATFTTTTTEGCSVENTLTVSITIYPNPTMTLVSEMCLLVLESSCLNAPVTWSDDLGNNGTGLTYEAEAGTTGTVIFMYDSNGCFQEYTASFNCPVECDEPAQATTADVSICSNESIDLTDLLSANAMAVSWSENGDVLTNSATYEVSNNGCETLVNTITAVYFTTAENDCPIEHTLTINVSIFPVPTMAVNMVGACMFSLNSSCGDAPISWSDDLGNSGSGTTYEAEDGTSGTVTFSYEENGCTTTVDQSFNCPSDCGELTENYESTTSLCSGESINLNNFLPINTNVEWMSEAGEVLLDPANFNKINTSCNANATTLNTTFFTTNDDGCTITNTVVLNMVIYPIPTIEVLSVEECSIAVDNECPDITLTWTDNLGNSGVGSSYEATEGTTGTVTFGYEADECGNEMTFDFNCPVECADSIATYFGTTTVCGESTIDLNELVGEELIWFDESGAEISNTLTVSNTTCDPILQELYGAFETVNLETNCPINNVVLFEITILPAPVLALVSEEDCFASVSLGGCPDVIFYWSDSQNNYGESLVYEPEPATEGVVIFTAIFPAYLECSYSVIASYGCSDGVIDNCEEPTTVSYDFISKPVCSEQSVDLHQYLPNGVENVQWTDATGNVINNPTTYMFLNSNCETAQLEILAYWTEFDENGCEYIYQQPLQFYIAPVPSLEIISSDCSLQAIPSCPSLIIYWGDSQGNIGFGNTFESATNETSDAYFIVYDPMAPSSCNQVYYPTTYTCGSDCEDLYFVDNDVIDACEDETIYFNDFVDAQQDWVWTNEDSHEVDNELLITNDGCEMETSIYTGVYQEVTEDGCTNTYEFNLTINKLPNIEVIVETDNCSMAVIPVCENASVFWVDTDGNMGEGANYDFSAVEGEVTFVSSWNDGTDCGGDSYTLPIECVQADSYTDIELSITTGNAFNSFENGDWVYWVVTVENTSAGSVGDVVVNIPIPTALIYNTSTGDGEYVASENVWYVGNVPAFTIKTLVLYTTISQAGPIGLQGEVESMSGTDIDSTPGNGDMFEDDFAMAAILVADQPNVDCTAPITACTPINAATEICIDFCDEGYAISMLSSTDEGELTILSPNCFKYLPTLDYTGITEVVISACDESGQNCELKSAIVTVSDDCENEGAALLLEADCKIVLPNVLTPNNDGINDNLIVSALRNCYSDWEMDFVLFDRWGNIVAQQQDPNEHLIGDVNLGLLKEETCFYTLRLHKGELKKVMSGFIEIRR